MDVWTVGEGGGCGYQDEDYNMVATEILSGFGKTE